MKNLLEIKTPAEGEASARKADYGLANHGLSNLRMVYWNLPTEALYEEIAFRREARLVATLAKLLKEKGGGRGLISVCTAGGMGVTAILER